MSSLDRAKTVGFVGLGVMGGPMAENILKGGFPIVVHDRNRHKVERLVALGGQAGSSPGDIAQRCSTMICMVDTTEQAEEVVLGPGGFIAAIRPGDIVLCNMLFQLNRVVIAETLAFAAKIGLDSQVVFDLVSSTASNSPAFQLCVPRMLARDFSAGIRLDIAYKDIDLQMQLAKRLGMDGETS